MRIPSALGARRRPRRARTPLMLQMEDTECGAVCLGIVLAYFGRWTSVEELREACAVNRDGCDAADITRAARGYGLEPQGWRREPEHLHEMTMPLIIFWEFNHFLVLEGFRGGNYLVNDPANGHRTLSAEEFDQGFTGIALSFKVGPDFRPGGSRPGVVRRLWPWLSDVTGPLAFALCCGLLLSLPVAALPFLLNVFVDHVLSGTGAAVGSCAGGRGSPGRRPGVPADLAATALSQTPGGAAFGGSRRPLHQTAVSTADAILHQPLRRRPHLPDPADRPDRHGGDRAVRRGDH